MTQMVRKNNKNLPLLFFNIKIIESSWHIDRLNTLIKKNLLRAITWLSFFAWPISHYHDLKGLMFCMLT